MPSDDTTVFRSLAVTAADVVAALEANITWSDAAVLRGDAAVRRPHARPAPPRGRRGRRRPGALHVPPERFVVSPTPVPSPDYAEDAVRAGPAATDHPETATRPPSGSRATTSGPRW